MKYKFLKTLLMLLNIIYCGSFVGYDFNYHYNIFNHSANIQYNNSDIIGTLSINNYPYEVLLLKGNNNDYYLNHTPFKTVSSLGSVYIDHRYNNANFKHIIYGHNSRYGDAPFKILENYFDKSFYDKYPCMNLSINSIRETYCIFSVYITENDFEHLNLKFNNKSFLEHLKSLQSKSIYHSDANFTFDSKIIILQTCCEFSFCSKYQNSYIVIALIKV